MIARIQPVGIHSAQVLHLQFDQRLGELSRVAEFLRKGIGLELELAAQDVHEQLEDGVHGAHGVGEEDEADHDGLLAVEAEGLVQRLVVDEDGEEGEDVEHVRLRDAE